MMQNNLQKTLEPGYSIEIINSFYDAAKYREQWNELVLNTETPSPFLSFEWFEIWWKCFESKDKFPHLIFIWKDELLIGIAPLMRIKLNRSGFTIYKLEFVSMMKYAYSVLNLAGYLDFIVRKGFHQDFFKNIMNHLNNNYLKWDYIRLHPILSSSTTLSCLKEIKKDYKLSLDIRRVFFSSKIVFDNDWESYLKKLSKDFIKRLFSREKKLKQLGKLEIVNITKSDNIEEIYKDLVEIDHLSWKNTKGTTIDSKKYNNFYLKILEEFSKNNNLFIGFVKFNDKKIAYDIILKFDKLAIALKTSYDPDYRQYGTGNLISYYNIKSMFESGFKEINLLWGNIKSKLVWKPQLEEYVEIFIFNNRLKSKLINFFYHKLQLYRIIRYINIKFLNKC